MEVKKHTVLEEIAFTRDETASGLSRIVFSREQLVISSRLFFKEMFWFQTKISEFLFGYKVEVTIPNTIED